MQSETNQTPSYQGNRQSSFKLERQKTSTLRKMSAEMMDTAEETIIDYITCPHCKDYIQPPSSCCENGHFICRTCREQVATCPSCGCANYPNQNNTIFDMILKDLYYPCNYQGNGCSAYFKYWELKDHHAACKFKLEPCAFQPAGCPLSFKASEKAAHEAACEFGVSCRIYVRLKGIITTRCDWRGMKHQLPHHVTKSHQLAWCPHQIESNVALPWTLPINFDFEKVELLHLKDIDEMFYFYSKSIGSDRHFLAVQHVGNKDNSKEFMYAVEFVLDSKKVGFEDVVVPSDTTEEEVYKCSNCFSVQYDFLKKHFHADSVIDCYVKVFRKEQRTIGSQEVTDSL